MFRSAAKAGESTRIGATFNPVAWYPSRVPQSSRFLIGALLLATSAQAFSWSDTGHMVIAAIAERQLKPQALAEAQRLIAIGGTERTSTFLTAACWADDTRTRENGPWHYINLHFRTDGKATTNVPEPENAAVAITRFQKVLADRTRPDAERADALRYLLHFVGDLHQPLHAVARDTDEHPQGDRGGNEFRIQPPAYAAEAERPPRNLHSLWDSGCGLFHYEPRPLNGESERHVRLQADTLLAALPKEDAREATILDPMVWASEGLALAKSVVYNLPENTVPGDAYLKAARTAAAKRAALAGHRLAALLNNTLAP